MDAIIFDLDDTLVVDEVSAQTAFLKTCLFAQAHYGASFPGFYSTIRETCRYFWYASPAREYCLRVGVSSWEGLWAEFSGTDENLAILHEWAPTYRKLSWLTTLQKFGRDDEEFALEMAQEYIDVRRQLHILYPDVLPALEELGNRYRLGLITNGLPDLQMTKIQGAGLDNYFDEIIISGELGTGKPDASIFREMLNRLEIKADAAVMVGDSLQADIQGAQAAGMNTIWVNRTGQPTEAAVFPDFTVNSLSSLPEILQGD